MENIVVGKHYAFDNGNPYELLIMFITRKDKYYDEDVFYFDTISLNPIGEVFEKIFEEDFFKNGYIRLATTDEIQKLRSRSPDENWIKSKIDEIVNDIWGINERPMVIVDPDEELTKEFIGAYDPQLKALIFRSEFLAVNQKEYIEKVITHELCHWYLHTNNLPYRDQDLRFAQEIIKANVEDTLNHKWH
ncbi:protein sprT [Bacillus halotolerans]|uniref:protein sprT n=1 Tax=Bacillus halotolerans TaxID=260554 RepID=UPI004048FA7A